LAKRDCEGCGRRQPDYRPRKNVDGKMLCPMCQINEMKRQGMLVAVRQTQGRDSGASSRHTLLHAVAARRPSIVRIAHDSGDGETLFHCPFCGSGQIVARSDGAVDCDFCNTAFTVQVQPQMPAFPQTINGVPIDVPGMPKGGEDADVPPDEAAAAGYPPGAGGSDPNGMEDPSADPSTDTDAGDDEESGPQPPPFATNARLRTTAGREVPFHSFVASLALEFTHDRYATLQRARTEQRS
jgi:uncharacterized Zn finger protein (UPF0148 family)